MRLKVSIYYSLVLLAISLTLGVFPKKSYHSHNKDTLMPYALIKEISRVLGAQSQKWGQRPNITLLINHAVTMAHLFSPEALSYALKIRNRSFTFDEKRRLVICTTHKKKVWKTGE